MTRETEQLASVSVLLLVYNHKDFIGDAIHSIFGQTRLPDEIVISDDASTDGTLDVVRRYLDSKSDQSLPKIVVRQNQENLGFVRHLNLAVEACTGDLIIYCSGDDISEPPRTEELASLFQSKGCPKYFLTHSDVITVNGQVEYERKPPITDQGLSLFDLGRLAALHIGATQAFTKSLFQDFGGIRHEQAYEDLVLGYRAALMGQLHYLPKPLVRYRVGGLTSWTKNPYPLKRKRFQDVLCQRIHDCSLLNRVDLQANLTEYMHQLGLGLEGGRPQATVLSLQGRRGFGPSVPFGVGFAHYLGYFSEFFQYVPLPLSSLSEDAMKCRAMVQSYKAHNCDLMLLVQPLMLTTEEFDQALTLAVSLSYPFVLDLGAEVFFNSDEMLSLFKRVVLAVENLSSQASLSFVTQAPETAAALKKLTSRPSFLIGPMANCDALRYPSSAQGQKVKRPSLVIRFKDLPLSDGLEANFSGAVFWDVFDGSPYSANEASSPQNLSLYSDVLILNSSESINAALERLVYFELLLSGVTFQYLHWPTGFYFEQDAHYTFLRDKAQALGPFKLVEGHLNGYELIQGQTVREFLLEWVYLQSSVQKKHPNLLALMRVITGSSLQFYDRVLPL